MGSLLSDTRRRARDYSFDSTNKVVIKEVEKSISKNENRDYGKPKGYEPGPSQFIDSFSFTSLFPLTNYYSYNYSSYRQDYLTCPPVHSCINGICREISNMHWGIKPVDGYENKIPKKLVPQMIKFFKRPNRNRKPFSQLIYAAIKDALIYSNTGIENVLNGKGELTEIYPRDGSTIIPVADKHGVIKGYKQVVGNEKAIFNKDELVYIEYNPDTYSPGGGPILEGLTDVCKALRNAIEFLARSLDYNSIPPGILSAPSLTSAKAKEIGKEMKGLREGAAIDYEIVTVGGVSDLEWIEFKRRNKDKELGDEIEKLERMVFRAFGVTPIEAGDSDIVRATAMVQHSIGQSKQIKPLVDLFVAEINDGIIWTHMTDMAEMFAEPNVQRTREIVIEENIKLIPLGLRTINEGRKYLNEEPVKGGNNAFYQAGGLMIKIADLDKDASDVQPLNISQPDKNRTQDESKDEEQKVAAERKKAIQIVKNRQEKDVRSLVSEYFKNNGFIGNQIRKIYDSLYFKLFDSVNIKLDLKEFKSEIMNGVRIYERKQSKKNKLTDDEFTKEKQNLFGELNVAFNKIIGALENVEGNIK